MTKKAEAKKVEKAEAKETKQQKSLVQKLAEVMLEVRYIEKSGYNDFQKYTYVTEADVVERIRLELAKRHVILMPNLLGYKTRELTTKKQGIVTIFTVDMEYTFMDGETGEKLSFNFTGEGQDNAEKAVYKAYTGAQKYALLKFFMLPTGDEPEQDNSDLEVMSSGGAYLDRIAELVNDIAKDKEQRDKLKTFVQKNVGAFDDYIDLTEEQQARAVAVLEAVKKKKAAG